MKKIVRIGRGRYGKVFCEILIKDGNLSIHGVEGPKSNGDCVGSCGQIVMSEWNIAEYAPEWNRGMERKFREIWHRWHLNDMVPGTPSQMQFLREHAAEMTGYDHYKWACETLKAAGLYEDNGYRYGSAWLKEELPAEVIEWLAALPETDIQPNWV